jgi:hypothetical protein
MPVFQLFWLKYIIYKNHGLKNEKSASSSATKYPGKSLQFMLQGLYDIVLRKKP